MASILKDLKIIDNSKILGEGTFSQVYKVLNIKNKKTYALKKIDLSVLSKGDFENLKSEISLHKSLSHKNIIKFVKAFQIKNQLYILLEEAKNGSLFFYIHTKKGLPKDIIKKIFYQICKSIKYLHKKNIIHRDLKPENILLDKDFNVKICDFGWSCFLNNKKKRNSICGTYEYMSPEIFNEKSYNHKIDIWCLGILLYEMIHGNPPFFGDSLEEMKNQFLNEKIFFKEGLDFKIFDLLKKLLVIDDEKRLGIEEVLNHSFFENDFKVEEDCKEIMIKHYMENCRSGKRNDPECVKEFKNNLEKKKDISIKKVISNKEKIYNKEDILYKQEVFKEKVCRNWNEKEFEIDFFNSKVTKIDVKKIDNIKIIEEEKKIDNIKKNKKIKENLQNKKIHKNEFKINFKFVDNKNTKTSRFDDKLKNFISLKNEKKIDLNIFKEKKMNLKKSHIKKLKKRIIEKNTLSNKKKKKKK